MSEQLEGVFREDDDRLLDHGFSIKFVTMRHNSPPHWHRAMELLFVLNGKATVTMEGKKHMLKPLDLIVIDSAKVHDVVYAMPQSMGICIHISKNFMRRYIAGMELMRFQCDAETLEAGGQDEQKQEAYMELCGYMKDLTILYMNQKQSYQLKCSAGVLNILAVLVDHFSSPASDSISVSGYNKLARMEQIYQYVEKHHSEGITLQDGAQELGLNREYFCRFFKENMGISFIAYVNQVRIDHIYQDLLHTEEGIQEILERHGFYNQKLFYQKFKERYDCTPGKLRQIAKNNPYM